VTLLTARGVVFCRDDLVLTPSGRKALVRGVLPDARIDCVYTDAAHDDLPLSHHTDSVALPPELLRKIQRGRPMPEPVRVED